MVMKSIENCEFLPKPENRKYLGEFYSCDGAVREKLRKHIPELMVVGLARKIVILAKLSLRIL